MERIPILKMGRCLLVSIQVDMHDRLAMTLQDDLTARIAETNASGVLIDISALESLNDGARRGLRLVFEDQGPGIPDIDQALRNGFTTGAGLGLGGARRLVTDFDIDSNPGSGTRVTITRWK